MEWISIKEQMPDCHSQHGDAFATGYLLTLDVDGEFERNQFWQYGKHTSNGWIKEGEKWEIDDVEITHWMRIERPKQKSPTFR